MWLQCWQISCTVAVLFKAVYLLKALIETHATTFMSHLYHQLWGLTIISWRLMVEVCVSCTASLVTSVSDLCMCSALCSHTNSANHSLKDLLIETRRMCYNSILYNIKLFWCRHDASPCRSFSESCFLSSPLCSELADVQWYGHDKPKPGTLVWDLPIGAQGPPIALSYCLSTVTHYYPLTTNNLNLKALQKPCPDWSGRLDTSLTPSPSPALYPSYHLFNYTPSITAQPERDTLNRLW